MSLKDLHGLTTRKAQAARAFINVMQPMTKMLDILVAEFFLKEYKKLKPTEAARRCIIKAKEGCFSGLATVWKFQVDAYVNGKNYDIYTITCEGSFNGYHLHLPDLNISLW